MWLVIIILALLIPLVAVILDSPPARALASRLERPASQVGPSVQERMAALEGEVERLGREVERIAEEGAFLQKLLESRSEAGPRALPGRSPADPEGGRAGDPPSGGHGG